MNLVKIAHFVGKKVDPNDDNPKDNVMHMLWDMKYSCEVVSTEIADALIDERTPDLMDIRFSESNESVTLCITKTHRG